MNPTRGAKHVSSEIFILMETVFYGHAQSSQHDCNQAAESQLAMSEKNREGK